MISPVYHLFLGTFVHLPRETADGKHVLEINRGALWVSTSDGRIKGYRWDVRDDDGLRGLMKKEKWVEDDGQASSSPKTTKVKITRAREDQNEFFFPGFIGTYVVGCFIAVSQTDADRHSHPRPPVPQLRSLWLLESLRMVTNVHVPAREVLRGSPNRYPAAYCDPHLRSSRCPHAVARDHLRRVFCHHPRPCNELPVECMSPAWPASFHRTHMHGPREDLSG